MTHTIEVIRPEGSMSIKAVHGARLFDVLAGAGVQFDAPCGGRCFCGKCCAAVRGAKSEMSADEARFFTDEERAAGFRLICALTVECDMTVSLDMHSAQICVDTAQVDDVCPAVKSRLMDMPAPSLADPRADEERLGVQLTFNQLKKLPYALRECDFKPEIVDMRGKTLYVGKPGAGLYGAAVDVGTTTIAAYLMDLSSGKVLDMAGALNPQRVYGGDVITRSDFASKSEENAMQMQRMAVECIGGLIAEMAKRSGISAERIFHIVAVGNTTMMHMLAGLTTRNIAVSPFIPVSTREITLPARDVGFALENAMLTVSPCVAGYVGADTVACVLDCGIDMSDKNCLMVDIGTNGEIALGNKNGILCCSTAAGPALEGAHISCGMGGVSGAISHVRFGGGAPVLDVIGGGKPKGICGSGLVDAIAGMLDVGWMDEMGGIDDEAMGALADEADGRPALALAPGIMITQRDVREVQLAKAAIAAGIETLMKQAGIDYDDIDRLYLAGGFGNYIDRERASRIGLLPARLLDRMQPVGNAAGSGAQRMLLNERELERASTIAQSMKYIELSARADFQELFIDGMCFE